MSRAGVVGGLGTGAWFSATGTSGELATWMAAGSTPWAQQPQVTHIGGQAASSWPDCSSTLHGSPTTSAETPDDANASRATTMASANRGTPGSYPVSLRSGPNRLASAPTAVISSAGSIGFARWI